MRNSVRNHTNKMAFSLNRAVLFKSSLGNSLNKSIENTNGILIVVLTSLLHRLPLEDFGSVRSLRHSVHVSVSRRRKCKVNGTGGNNGSPHFLASQFCKGGRLCHWWHALWACFSIRSAYERPRAIPNARSATGRVGPEWDLVHWCCCHSNRKWRRTPHGSATPCRRGWTWQAPIGTTHCYGEPSAAPDPSARSHQKALSAKLH